MKTRRFVQCSKVSNGYYPIDELLEVPRVRILRALNRFDWALSGDLRVALDIEETVLEINKFARTLSSLVKERLVDMDGSGTSHRYRINDRGRAQLKQVIARGSIATADEGVAIP